jgi:hypothetical protein
MSVDKKVYYYSTGIAGTLAVGGDAHQEAGSTTVAWRHRVAKAHRAAKRCADCGIQFASSHPSNAQLRRSAQQRPTPKNAPHLHMVALQTLC